MNLLEILYLMLFHMSSHEKYIIDQIIEKMISVRFVMDFDRLLENIQRKDEYKMKVNSLIIYYYNQIYFNICFYFFYHLKIYLKYI